MRHRRSPKYPDRRRAYAVASIAHCDHRVAEKALRYGVEAVRGAALREAIARAIEQTAPQSAPDTSPSSPSRAA